MQTNSLTLAAAPGTTGVFEVSLGVPTGGTTSTVTGFSLTLTATATTASGLTFTGASMSTAPDAYVFLGVSTKSTDSQPLSPSVFPNTSFAFADTDTNSTGVSIVAGVTFGLAEVAYNVDANATPGVYTLSFGGTVTQTGSFDVIMPPGTFTILAAPEPNTCILAGLAAAIALVRFIRTRRMAA